MNTKRKKKRNETRETRGNETSSRPFQMCVHVPLFSESGCSPTPAFPKYFIHTGTNMEQTRNYIFTPLWKQIISNPPLAEPTFWTTIAMPTQPFMKHSPIIIYLSYLNSNISKMYFLKRKGIKIVDRIICFTHKLTISLKLTRNSELEINELFRSENSFVAVSIFASWNK